MGENQELVEYFKKYSGKGYSEEALKKEAKRQGWKPNHIKDAWGDAHKKNPITPYLIASIIFVLLVLGLIILPDNNPTGKVVEDLFPSLNITELDQRLAGPTQEQPKVEATLGKSNVPNKISTTPRTSGHSSVGQVNSQDNGGLPPSLRSQSPSLTYYGGGGHSGPSSPAKSSSSTGFSTQDFYSCGTVSSDFTMSDDTRVNGTCFNITANNVVLDCAGHTINGSGSGVLITIANGVSGATIKNCILRNADIGVTVAFVNNTKIINSQFYNFIAPLYIFTSNNTIFENNTVNGYTKIEIESTNHAEVRNVMIKGNKLYNMTYEGVRTTYYTNASNITIEANDFRGAFVTHNLFAVEMHISDPPARLKYIQIIGNNFTNFTRAASFVDWLGSESRISDLTMQNNVMSNSSTTAAQSALFFLARYPDNNIFVLNNTFDNTGMNYSIWMLNAMNSIVANNSIRSCNASIELISSNVTLLDNLIDNTSYGIHLTDPKHSTGAFPITDRTYGQGAYVIRNVTFANILEKSLIIENTLNVSIEKTILPPNVSISNTTINLSEVTFNQTVDLTARTSLSRVINLKDNYVSVNSSLAPQLNVSAVIRINSTKMNGSKIFVDYGNGVLQDCPSEICSVLSVISKQVIFGVNSFSSYQLQSGPVVGCAELYDTAVLTNDLYTNGSCITINNSGVTLDCAYHSITGNTSGILIDAKQGLTEVTIKNCVLSNASIGIRYANVINSKVLGVVVNNTPTGLSISGANNSIITKTAIYNSSIGIYLSDSLPTIVNMTSILNSSEGILINDTNVGSYRIFNSTFADITQNTLLSNTLNISINQTILPGNNTFIYDRNSYSKLVFNESLNLTNYTDFSRATSVGDNSILVNSSLAPQLNRSAVLTINSTRDTGTTITVDFGNGVRSTCPASICTTLSVEDKKVVFAVNSFSSYRLNLLSEVAQCGAVLYSNTTLNSDLYTNGTCFTIIESGVTLDCAGHTIYGDRTGPLITGNPGLYNTTITNCVFKNASVALSLGTIYNTTIQDGIFQNLTTGIQIVVANETKILNISIDHCNNSLSLTEMNFATIANNTFTNFTDILVNGARDLVLASNKIYGYSGSIHLTSLTNGTITSNNITKIISNDGAPSFQMYGRDTTITSNNIEGGSVSAWATDESRLTVRNNQINNSICGIHIGQGEVLNNTLSNIYGNNATDALTGGRTIIANNTYTNVNYSAIDLSYLYGPGDPTPVIDNLVYNATIGIRVFYGGISIIQNITMYNISRDSLQIIGPSNTTLVNTNFTNNITIYSSYWEPKATLTFTQPIDLTEKIYFLPNVTRMNDTQIRVNSSQAPEFNRTAVLRFASANSSDPKAIIDREDDGTFELCPSIICSNFSNAMDNFTFAVSGFTTYGIWEVQNRVSECGGYINQDTVLTNNLNTSSKCFTLNKSNIILDCDGYTITGSLNGVLINSSYGLTNLTVQNCILRNASTAIQLTAGNNTKLINISVENSSAALSITDMNLTIVANCSFTNFDHIRLTGIRDTLISSSNLFVSNPSGQIILENLTNVTFSSNNVTGPPGDRHCTSAPVSVISTNNHTTFISNTFRQGGISVASGNLYYTSTDLVIQNNIFANSPCGINVLSIGQENIKILNNTLENISRANATCLFNSTNSIIANNSYKNINYTAIHIQSSRTQIIDNIIQNSSFGIILDDDIYAPNETGSYLIKNFTFFNISRESLRMRNDANLTATNTNFSANITLALSRGTGVMTAVDASATYTQPIDLTGKTYYLPDFMNLTNRSVWVNSSFAPEFNRTAILTFSSSGYSSPKAQVDYLDNGNFVDCPASICTTLSTAGGYFTFNVSGFTTYRMGQRTTCGTSLNEDTTLTEDLTSQGNCFTLNKSNLALDCEGHMITGDQTGQLINSTPGLTNITIKNCSFRNTSTAIDMIGGNDTKIINISIENSTTALSLNSMNLTVIANSTFTNFTDISFSGLKDAAFIANRVYQFGGHTGIYGGFNISVRSNRFSKLIIPVCYYPSIEISASEGVSITSNYLIGSGIFSTGSQIAIQNNVLNQSMCGMELYGGRRFVLNNTFNNIYGVNATSIEGGDGDNTSIIANNTYSDINSTAISIDYFGSSTVKVLDNRIFNASTGVVVIFYPGNITIQNNTIHNITRNSLRVMGPMNITLINNNFTANITFATEFWIRGSDLTFINPIDLTGKTYFLPDILALNNTQVRVNSTLAPEFNKTAVLSLNSSSYANPRALIDPEDDGTFVNCPSTICTNLSNTGGNFIFNVSGFTTYGIGEASSEGIACGTYLNADTTLTEDLTAQGNCFTLNKSNLILDCGGHTITGNLNGVTLNSSFGLTNITVQNCTFRNASTAIQLTGSNDTKVLKVSVENSTTPIVLTNMNLTLVANSTFANFTGITLSGLNEGYLITNRIYQYTDRIYLSNLYHTTITGNNISKNFITDFGAASIYITGSQNETTMRSNLITGAGVRAHEWDGNLTFQDNTINQTQWGITMVGYYNGNGGVSRFLNNTISNVYGDNGTSIEFGNSTILANNTYKDISRTAIDVNTNFGTYTLIDNKIYNASIGIDIRRWEKSDFGVEYGRVILQNLSMVNISNMSMIVVGSRNMTIINTNLTNKVMFSHGVFTQNSYTEFTRMTFTQPIDLSAKTYFLPDILFLNTTQVRVNSTIAPEFNRSAIITLPDSGFPHPKVMVDYLDNGDFSNCHPSKCQVLTHEGGFVTFDVTGFTSYQLKDTVNVSNSPPGLQMTDDSGNVVEDGTVGVILQLRNGTRILFEFNLTNSTDFGHIRISYNESATVLAGWNETENVTPTHTLYLPNNNGNAGLYICPEVYDLPGMRANCNNAAWFEGPFPESNLTEAGNITVIVQGNYYKVKGLNHSGGEEFPYKDLKANATAVHPAAATFYNSSRFVSSEGGPSNASAQGGNTSQMDFFGNASTSKWQGYYGNASGRLVLGQGEFDFYNFTRAVPMFVAVTQDPNFNFAEIRAANTTLLDQHFGFDENDTDSATKTFNSTGKTLGGIGYVPYAPLEGGTWYSGVYDNGSASSIEGDSRYYAFGTEVNKSQTNFVGSMSDFELLVGTNSTTGINTNTVYFFMQIK